MVPDCTHSHLSYTGDRSSLARTHTQTRPQCSCMWPRDCMDCWSIRQCLKHGKNLRSPVCSLRRSSIGVFEGDLKNAPTVWIKPMTSRTLSKHHTYNATPKVGRVQR
ncbi:hypothetical protein DPMN_141487 [Dreissena polymorpha]|uniref:Uncharacterized protein n=1 Tax=Dreissena polymorpha TaxID=45954 RepID=A0A9D4G9K3_DREPO|nr:hypothetical protein DPMN_141487 [Dreissena polymorpha]